MLPEKLIYQSTFLVHLIQKKKKKKKKKISPSVNCTTGNKGVICNPNPNPETTFFKKKKKDRPQTLAPVPALPRVLLTPTLFFSLQTWFMLNLVNSKRVNFKQIGSAC